MGSKKKGVAGRSGVARKMRRERKKQRKMGSEKKRE